MNELKVNFLGWENVFGKFEISGGMLPNRERLRHLIVAYEGNWIENLSGFYPDIDYYEDAQKKFGSGLVFLGKEFCHLLKRSFFKFKMEDSSSCLVVPASGEELHFEIYGTDAFGVLFPLLEQEL